MSKKRVITVINIMCSILMITGIFLPIVATKYLFASSSNTSKYFIVLVSLISIVVNLIDRKVEYGFISSGFVFFYLFQFSWGMFFGMAYGFYIMFFASLLLMILTAVYGFMEDEKEDKQPSRQNVHSQFRSNGRVMNGYPNRNAQGNMQMPYPNQMMYRNGQMYNNNYKR